MSRKIDTVEARQGERTGVARKILVPSLTLAAIALGVTILAV